MGASGSGKSTFAKRLHQVTNLPLIHLDQVYWKPNWVESTEEEWRVSQKELVSKEEWIMDGNYSGTWDLRLPRADTLIFLSQPTYKLVYRVLKRTFSQWGKTRADMTEDCPERWDWEFFHYVITFNLVRKNSLLKRLKENQTGKSLFILKKQSEIDSFFENLTLSKSMG